MVKKNKNKLPRREKALWSLTSEANWFLYLLPLRAGHCHQRALFPPHQTHGDYITNYILPGFHSDHTEGATTDHGFDCSFLLCPDIGFSSGLPLQVGCVDGLVADGTLGPALVTQIQVVQHAWPAEDVTAASDARCQGWVQADGARWHLMAVDALQAHTRWTFVKCTKEEFKRLINSSSPLILVGRLMGSDSSHI